MSTNKQVWDILQTDPSILKNYSRKLINTRALARHILKEHQLDASIDAVISSIRRFPLQEHKEEQKLLGSIFKDAEVSTKNNIACITIPGEPHQAVSKLSSLKLPPLRISSGTGKIKIVLENDEASKVASLFKNCEIVRNLSEISIIVSEKANKTKGVLARIAAELSLAGINIHELFLCAPQFLIYVNHSDMLKAHERILSLANFK